MAIKSLLTDGLNLYLVLQLVISILLGAFIGLERERIQQRIKIKEFGGIRTFSFISLLGFISSYLQPIIGISVAIIAMIFVLALLLVNYTNKLKYKQIFGMTSEMAATIAFIIGFTTYINPPIAIITAILVTFILSEKESLHSFAKQIKDEEFTATLKFALLSFVVLPLLPNATIDPWNIFNPYKIWLLVLLILGINFIGYILTKLIGENKGIFVTAILGGLASSTALTESMAEKSKQANKLYRLLAVATIIGSGIMFIRIGLLVFAFNKNLFTELLIPFGVMLFVTLVTAFINFYFVKDKQITIPDGKNKITESSPLKLIPAIKFALFFTLTLFGTYAAKNYLGENGIYLAGILSGIIDVDVFSLSMIEMANDNEQLIHLASQGIAIVTISNMFFKGIISYISGTKEFSKTIMTSFAIISLTGLAIILIR